MRPRPNMKGRKRSLLEVISTQWSLPSIASPQSPASLSRSA